MVQTRSNTQGGHPKSLNTPVLDQNDVSQLRKPRRTAKKYTSETLLHEQELFRRKKRETEKRRRQRIRENPEDHEIYCRKERERNQRRRADGKLKSIDQLSQREKRIRRAAQNERKIKSRMKQKSSFSPPHQDANDDNVLSKQARVGRKRVAKNSRKCYRDNRLLTEQNYKLKKTINTLRKRIARTQLKKPRSTSPNSEVNDFLKRRRVDNDIRKKLISSEILMQLMRDTYKDSTSDKCKQILGRILCGKVIRKYRNLTIMKKRIARVVSSRIRLDEDPLKYVRKENASQHFIRNKIRRFYEENSQMDPGKRYTKQVDGKLVSRHYMNASLKDLHAKFNADSAIPVSYPVFAKNRPPYCVAPKVTQRNMCACYLHENFALLVKALHRMKIIQENTIQEIITHITCIERSEQCLSRVCRACVGKEVNFNVQHVSLSQEMFYPKWQTSTITRLNEKTQKPITVTLTKKITVTSTVDAVLEVFRNELQSLMAHEYRLTHQKKIMKKLTENLKSDEMVLLIDSSENYSSKYGTEVQSVHFGASREQYTLHTGILYTTGFTKGFSTLSKSFRHDPAAIIVHLKKILDVFLPQYPAVQKLRFMSDGPTTQYRNRKMFHLVTQYLPECYHQLNSISYNFSEAGHGKSPADGIGGCLKRTADDRVKYGHDIPDFGTLVSTLRTQVRSVHIDTVMKEEIGPVDTVLPTQVKPFQGTMKVHQYTWQRDNPGLVFFNSLSCFDCPPGTECVHFTIGLMNYTINIPPLFKNPPATPHKAQKKKKSRFGEKNNKNGISHSTSKVSSNPPPRRSSRIRKQ